MKILSKQEVKDTEKNKRDKLISEFSDLQENTDNALLEFNTIKDEKQLELTMLDGRLDALRLEHGAFVLNKEREIADLLSKKSEAEKPLDEKIAKLDIKVGELSKVEQVLNVKDLRLKNIEKELAKNKKEFTSEIVRLSEIRASARDQVEAFNLAEVRIGRQKKEFLEMSKGFYEKKSKAEESLNQKKLTLRSRTKALDGYANSLNEKQEILNNLEIKLKSERQALTTAQKEIYGKRTS